MFKSQIQDKSLEIYNKYEQLKKEKTNKKEQKRQLKEEQIQNNISKEKEKSYFKILCKKLRKYAEVDDNYDIEELFKLWISVGCNNWFFEKPKKLYNLTDDMLPSYSNECTCSHYIEDNRYVYCLKTKIVVVIGSCCIKKFMNCSIDDKFCVRCKNFFKTTRRSNIDYCDSCYYDKLSYYERYRNYIKKEYNTRGFNQLIGYKKSIYIQPENPIKITNEIFEEKIPFSSYIYNKQLDKKILEYEKELKNISETEEVIILDKYNYVDNIFFDDDLCKNLLIEQEKYDISIFTNDNEYNKFIKGKYKVGFGKYTDKYMKDVNDDSYVKWIKKTCFTKEKPIRFHLYCKYVCEYNVNYNELSEKSWNVY